MNREILKPCPAAGARRRGAAAPLLLVLLAVAPARADTVTGTVTTPTGAPIAGVTLAFSGGITPINPVTNASGVFTVTVPAGTYDIDFLPATTAFAAIQMLAVQVAGTANLGIVVLQPGFVLTGTVRTSAGAPIALSDINVYVAATGIKLFTPNDNTNTLGVFSVVVPAGTFHVRATPPAGQILVAQQMQNVVVAAATNMGFITLPPGVIVTGTVRLAGTLAPLQDVDIDVDDAATGQRVITPSDNTNGSGVFSVIIPTGTFHFSFGPPPGMLVAAAQAFNIAITGTTNVGNILLPPGFALSGTVLGPGGVPVAGADIDVDTVLGNLRLYTPNDTTSAAGAFSVVVPAGNYTVTIEPPAGVLLVGAVAGPVVVAGGMTIAAVTLPAGVTLSGTLIGFDGLPEVAADVDVLNPSTGAELVTPNDASNASGAWSVIVPTGTWNVRFQPRKTSLSRNTLFSGIPVPGPTTLNAALPITPLAVYAVQAPPPAAVASGAPVFMTALVWNPTPAPAAVNIDILLVDPAGVEHPLFPAAPVVWPGNFFLYWPVLPVPLPPALPGHQGLPHRLRVRFTESAGGAEVDTDEFSFLIN